MDRRGPSRVDLLLQSVAVLLIILAPVTAVSLPATDYSWSSIDPNLVYVRSGPGSVMMNSTRMVMVADDALNSSVVNIASLTSGIQVQMQVEFPASFRNVGRFVVNFSSPYDRATANLVLDGSSRTIRLAQTNQSGATVGSQFVRAFSTSRPLVVEVLFVPDQSFHFMVSQDGTTQTRVLVFPGLATARPVNLDFWLTTSSRLAEAIVSNVVFILPHETNRPYFARGIVIDLQYMAIVSAALVGFRAVIKRTVGRILVRLSHLPADVVNLPSSTRRLLLLGTLAFPVQLFVMTLGSHPYDMFTQELWSYLVPRYGPSSVLPISLGVPGGKSVGGLSAIGSAYPYPPIPLYFFSLAGYLGNGVDPSGTVPSSTLEFILKLTWLAFLNLSAVVLFNELRRSGFRGRGSSALFLAVVLNPGLVFASLVWGQFDVVVGFFILLSLISVRREKWAKAFFFLFLAILSKQSALFFVPLLVPVIFLKSGLTRGLAAGGRSLIATFFVLLPWFLVGLSPAYVLSVSLGDIAVNAISPSPTGIAPWQLSVSRGASNIWPLVTWLANNQHGLARFQFPDSLSNQAFGLPYVEFGLVLAGLGVSAALVELWRAHRAQRLDSEYLLLIVISFLWIFTVLTRMSARYLAMVLPVSLLLLSTSLTERTGKALFGTLTLVLAFSLAAEPGLTVQTAARGLGLPNELLLTDVFITALSLAQLFAIGICIVATRQIYEFEISRRRKFVERPADFTSAPAEPKVSVVVLNYNGGPLAMNCIRSVLASTLTPVEVIVVDNASGDDSLRFLEPFLSDGRIRLVRNEANLGFALGNNRGAEMSTGNLLFFLNNDTEVTPNAIQTMVDRFVADVGLGAAQPLLRYLPETDRVYSAGNTLDRLAFHELIGQGLVSGLVRPDTTTSFAAGSALMIRSDLFKEVGGFEPMLVSYHTDSDLSWKVWLAGFRVVVVPEAIVYHAEGAMASSIPVEHRLYQTARNQLILVAKNYEFARALCASAALIGMYLLAAVVYAVHGNRRISYAFLAAIAGSLIRIKGIRDVRKEVNRFRKLSDREAAPRFLIPFNPIKVFHRRREGWGYRDDKIGTRLS